MLHTERPRLELTLTLAAMAVFVLFAVGTVGGTNSSDLLALWLAGDALTAGGPVYPPDTTVFTMTPPPEWIERARALGREGDVFPFLYPPLWAWIAGQIGQVVPWGGFVAGANLVNAILLAGTVLVASRLGAPAIRQDLFVAVSLVFLSLTTVGHVALVENQPQILVSFLILFALERSERGAAVTAGLALALAASIKLYPALFAIIWLATGQRRAVLAFAIGGAALAGLSILLAGWPLHREFLHLVGLISKTAVLSNYVYSADALVAYLFYVDAAREVPSADGGFWLIVAKPAAARLVSAAGLVLVLALAVLSLRRLVGAGDRALVWGATLIGVGLFGPLSWSYHYIAPVAMLPMIWSRLGARQGVAVLFALGLALYYSETPLLSWLSGHGVHHFQIATFAIALLLALYIGLIRRAGRPA